MCLFKQKHMCISGTYRDGDLRDGPVRAEGMVRTQRQPAESMGKLCQLGEQQMAGWPARSAALEGLPSSQRHFRAVTDCAVGFLGSVGEDRMLPSGKVRSCLECHMSARTAAEVT